jgi:hypothetical protein
VVFNRSEIVGGGNLYTSVEDLSHWDRALAEAADGRRPLVARLLTRPTLPGGDTIPYAYGVRQERLPGLADSISRRGLARDQNGVHAISRPRVYRGGSVQQRTFVRGTAS